MSGVKLRARVRGERVVTRNLRQLAKELEGNDLDEGLLAAAEVFAGRMRSRSPRGRKGNLQRGIVSYTKKRLIGNPKRTRGWKRPLKLRDHEAAADLLAPHSHLVEFGTKPHVIRPKKKTALRLHGGVYVPEVNHPGTRARPFFRPTVHEARPEAIKAMDARVTQLVARYD